MVARIGEVVALVRAGHPHGGFRAVVQNDLLGQPEAQVLLEKRAVAFDVYGQAIPMIEAAHVDATRGKALGLILQGRAQLWRSLVPLRFVVKLDLMAVWVITHKRRTVRQVAIVPADVESRSL